MRKTAIFGLILILAACSARTEKSTNQGPLESSYRMIDQGKTDEAIQQLEQTFKDNPSPEVREALASAYADRAGIRIKDFLGLLSTIQFQMPTNGSVVCSDTDFGRMVCRLRTSNEYASAPDLRSLVFELERLDYWILNLAVLPTVTGPSFADVSRALVVLEKTPRAGGRLYRALLGLVMLKSDFIYGFSNWPQIETMLKQVDFKSLLSAENIKLFCSADFRLFATWLNLLVKDLNSAGEDLLLAMPSMRGQLDTQLKDINKTSAQLNNLLGFACR